MEGSNADMSEKDLGRPLSCLNKVLGELGIIGELVSDRNK